ncbi:hypothetical protein SRIMM317S_04559 [Streptomyces rimosus subsp. rimosus]
MKVPMAQRMTGSCWRIGTTRTDSWAAPNCMASVSAVKTRPVRVIMPPATAPSRVDIDPESRCGKNCSPTSRWRWVNSRSAAGSSQDRKRPTSSRTTGSFHTRWVRSLRRVRYQRHPPMTVLSSRREQVPQSYLNGAYGTPFARRDTACRRHRQPPNPSQHPLRQPHFGH